MAYHPSRPSNGYHNQSYTPIAFNRSEGFLTRMFGRRDAAFFIQSLFKVDVRDVYLVGNVPGWHNALMTRTPSINDARVDAFDPSNRPLWLLDIIPPAMYHVVPQQIWTPPNQSDWRRYVEQANLRMPVFFIQNDGTIGLPLARAITGDRALRGADTPAPLGGGHSTQIRIAVSTSLFLFPQPPPPTPSTSPFPPPPSYFFHSPLPPWPQFSSKRYRCITVAWI